MTIIKSLLLTKNLLYSLALVLLVALSGVLGSADKVRLVFFDNFHWTLSYFIAATFAWLGWRNSSHIDRSTHFWFFVGLASFAFGQILWDIQVLLGWNPFPGPSDVFFLMLGVGCITGLMTALRGKLSDIQQQTFTLDIAILAISILILILVVYLPHSANTSLLQLVILSAYPILFLTASCIVLLTALHLRSKLQWPWLLFLLSLVLEGLIWMKWNFHFLHNALQDGSLFNLSFSIVTPALGLSAMHWRIVPVSDLDYQKKCEGVLRLLPLLGIVIIASAVIMVLLQDALPALRYLVFASSILILVFAFLRQNLLLSEFEHLLLAEQTLAENESRIRALGNNLPDGFIYQYQLSADKVPSFQYISESVQKINAVTAEAVLDNAGVLLSQLDARQLPLYLEAKAKSSRELSDFAMELLMHHPDGTKHWLQVRSRPRKVKDGAIIWDGIALDITQHKQMESVLRESEEKFRLLAESMPGLVWSTNQAGLIDYAAQSSIEFFGKPIKHIIGNNWQELVHPDDLPIVLAHIAESTQTGNPYSCEIRLRHHSGEYRWHLCTSLPCQDNLGQVTKWYGNNVDITHIKQANEKLKLLARVFAETNEGITITDVNCNIVDVNPRFCEITGYSRDEVIGKNPRILNSGNQSAEFYSEMWHSLTTTGHWQGELWNRRKNGEMFAELLTISTLRNDQGETLYYVGLFSDITQSKYQQQELELMAHYDPLTQLPNRILFADRFNLAIAHAKRENTLLAVCYLDLDGFKQVNDHLGHNAGDQLLVEMANRIKMNIRQDDTVSRLGGDEFAILIGQIGLAEQFKVTLDRIHGAIAQPYAIAGETVNICASSGVTLYPLDLADPDTLLRHADQAMYQAKQAGRNRYHLFDPEQDMRLQAKHQQISHIQEAFSRNEFCLFYQPKVNMLTGEVIGAEALIRWRHPERGILPPLEFLPLINDSPLDPIIGKWVIEEALRQMVSWRHQGVQLQVSVNISPHYLQQQHFFSDLQAALAHHPELPSQQLQLEIVESSVLTDMTAISKLVKVCRDTLGVSFALDDFGTGFSSLTYLRRLATHTIKIDQSFVRDMIDDPNDYAIIEGVIGLAKAFGCEIVAEGVETQEHGLLLLSMGCMIAQGYGIARPFPPEKMVQWIENYRPYDQWLHYNLRPQTPQDNLLLRLVTENNNWLERIKTCLKAKPGEMPNWPVMSHQKCNFGRWLVKAHKEQVFDADHLLTINQKHKELHQLGNQLMQSFLKGDIDQVETELDQLYEINRTLIKTLEGFQN